MLCSLGDRKDVLTGLSYDLCIVMSTVEIRRHLSRAGELSRNKSGEHAKPYKRGKNLSRTKRAYIHRP